MPQLLVARPPLRWIQAPQRCFELIERERVTSFFAPPTVWIAFPASSGLSSWRGWPAAGAATTAPRSCRCRVAELAACLPALQLYNRYGQSEIALLATVLRPRNTPSVLRPPGGRSSTSKPASSTATSTTPAGDGEIAPLAAAHERLLGTSRRRPRPASATAGSVGDVGYPTRPAISTSPTASRDIIKTGGVVVASREVGGSAWHHPRWPGGRGDRACPTSAGSRRVMAVALSRARRPRAAELGSPPRMPGWRPSLCPSGCSS